MRLLITLAAGSTDKTAYIESNCISRKSNNELYIRAIGDIGYIYNSHICISDKEITEIFELLSASKPDDVIDLSKYIFSRIAG